MEMEEEKSLADYIQMLRRRKYLIVFPMLFLLFISVIVALILPPVYRSEATILIEQQHIPIDLVKSTVVSFADERINEIQHKIMTVKNINKIINKYHLYIEQKKTLSQTELAENFKLQTELIIINADIIIQGRDKKATLAFQLAFSHKDPLVTQKVTSELTTLFLNENIRNRTQRALETTQFLDEEAEKFKVEIQKIENEIANYKDKYSNSLPELLTVNISSISRTEGQLQQLELQESLLNERRINLRTQLSMTSPNLSPVINSKEQAIQVETLPDLEAQYNYLLGRYSTSHPDVKAIKRKIDNFDDSQISAITPLINEQGINNPAYLQLKNEIDIATLETANISKQRIKLNQKLTQLELRVSQTHQVERGYYDLMRDLDNHKLKYKELKSKALEAKLSQTLEEEQKAEKFTLIEPARVPTIPEKPNRFKILIMGFVVSIGAGLGVGFLAEALDGSIRSHRTLEMLTGLEPLVVIPYVENQDDWDRTRKNKIIFIIISLLLIMGVILAVHFLYKPLDVLGYQVWDKLGLL